LKSQPSQQPIRSYLQQNEQLLGDAQHHARLVGRCEGRQSLQTINLFAFAFALAPLLDGVSVGGAGELVANDGCELAEADLSVTVRVGRVHELLDLIFAVGHHTALGHHGAELVFVNGAAPVLVEECERAAKSGTDE